MTQQSQKASAWVYIFVILAIALFGIPFIWIILVALATPAQISDGALSLLNLAKPAWSNFVDALTRIDFLGFARNSLLLSLITSVLSTASSAFVGFAFARMRAPGQRALFNVVIATMMIPAIATLIPTYVLFSRIGLVGTYWPWVLWGLAGTPYLIFLFRQFFSTIPLELEDAAIIDGAGWIRTFVQVFLPLARPAILTSMLLSFTWTWGDYLAPSLLLNYDNTTLSVATAAGYLDAHGSGILTLQAAAAVMYIAPIIVIFLFTQRYFMGSAVGSSVKG
ncbi:carbohydrate ABC transporter permease [Lacisediminihabitans changchengi]|uniref:Carbohydrate ABC transporter permease n=1 Tax=Lacisediminihabitans changchengi TaxID=2787634 RepID=A0A934SV79_9MICO|nr:carbohydrate ABC transporter permease [Lacisediminihabitans changchengi]MBK4348644.1 carbohydrate ABC transporter permease [Lacisediminihabitans changchengi]